MVVRVEEVRKILNDQDKSEVRKLEKIIDKTLRENFDGSEICVNVEDTERRVINELKMVYREAGWCVRYQKGGQREPDDYLIFTAGRARR